MHKLTITEISAGLRARRFSSVELTRRLLERIERFNGGLNAFLTVTAKEAREHGFTVAAVARPHTAEGLVAALERTLRRSRPASI